MASLKLITKENPLLYEKAGEIDNFADPKLKQLVSNMFSTMHVENGIGLAAPQIGKSRQLFVIDDDLIRETAMAETTSRLKKAARKIIKKHIRNVFINPKIISKEPEKFLLEEGCLTLPGTFGSVRRAEKLTISAKDELGKSFTITATGLYAHVLQHEMDHLDGTLFDKKAKKGSLHSIQRKPQSTKRKITAQS